MLKSLKSGLIFGIGFVIVLLLSGIVYGAWTNILELEANPEDNLTSDTWNNVIDNIDYLKTRVDGGVAVPSGAILAFNLDECPLGWLPANGNGSIMGKDIPDLRGKFVRGLNSFENGANKLTGTDSDEDGVNRDLGSLQGDAIRNITGSLYLPNYPGHWGMSGVFQAVGGSRFWQGASTGVNAHSSAEFDTSVVVPTGSDNRPKNIALIYCVKE